MCEPATGFAYPLTLPRLRRGPLPLHERGGSIPVPRRVFTADFAPQLPGNTATPGVSDIIGGT